VKDKLKEERPQAVPETAKQGGELRARWAWTEPEVWTERMLAALENGVKGRVWFSLMDKVYSLKNLRAAWKRVERNGGAAGIDRQTVEDFAAQAESSLRWLHEELREDRYRPKAIRRHWIPKPGSQERRPLGIPTVRDRIVQGAIRNVIEPIFERKFVEHSYGFRPRRSCKAALRRVDGLLRDGYTWVVDADIKSYFDTIDPKRLMAEVSKEIADGRVLTLLQAILQQPVMEGLSEWTPMQGTPQGAVVSPLLANIYLHPVDVELQRDGFEMVRYADDLVVLCKSESQARAALALLEKQMTERGLQLHPEKTRVVDATQPGGFDFLGYHFEQGKRTPRDKSLRRFKERVRELTPRLNGHSLEFTITKLNATLRGWFEYFKHSHRTVFGSLDSWIRMRLRRILERRRCRSSRSRNITNIRWPNAFFARLGLFTMARAWELARESR